MAKASIVDVGRTHRSQSGRSYCFCNRLAVSSGHVHFGVGRLNSRRGINSRTSLGLDYCVWIVLSKIAWHCFPSGGFPIEMVNRDGGRFGAVAGIYLLGYNVSIDVHGYKAI